MNYPKLFESTATEFTTNGIGPLSDAIGCTISVSLNGYSLFEMKYPVTGIRFSELDYRRIIATRSEVDGDIQGFRIYRITKPINGICTVYAYSLAYDLAGIAVTPFSSGSCPEALQGIVDHAVNDCPFTFWTDKTTVANFSVDSPTQANQLIGGHEGSILDVYGGEYEFDNFTIRLYNQRGQDRGVTLRYGKNITDYNQDQNCENIYTALLPYWADSDGNVMMLSEKTISCEGSYNFSRVKVVDASQAFEEQPTEDALRQWGQNYIDRNEINVPKVSWTINFLSLDETEEYKDLLALRARIWLGDTVHVYFPMYGVEASARCVGYTYNALTNKYDSISLGSVSSTLASQTIENEQQIKDQTKQQSSFLQQAVINATKLITGNSGGYVVLHSSTGSNEPDEILVMDQPDINTATKVWRWNKSGLGYSSNGYNGPYALAMTQDGAIVADFITTGTLQAVLIKSGTIRSTTGYTTLNLDTGDFKVGTDETTYSHLYPDGFDWRGGADSDGATAHGRIQAQDNRLWITSDTRYQMLGWQHEANGNYQCLEIEQVDNAVSVPNRLNVGGVCSVRSLTAWDGKDRVVQTDSWGNRGMAAMESPEPMFFDIGSAEIGADGLCYIEINPIYEETTSATVERRWYVTPTSSGALWVEKQPWGAIVHGDPGTTFDWIVGSVQRGYEGTYTEINTDRYPGTDYQPGDYIADTILKDTFDPILDTEEDNT